MTKSKEYDNINNFIKDLDVTTALVFADRVKAVSVVQSSEGFGHGRTGQPPANRAATGAAFFIDTWGATRALKKQQHCI